MPNWWQKPLRGLRLDLSGPLLTKMELRQLVEKTISGGVNLLIVSATSIQPGGSAFYPSRVAPIYPDLDTRDLLGEVIAAGHAGGQKVVAAVATIWGSRDLYIANPDWAQRKANGELTSLDEQNSAVAFCPNSPYREYLESLVEEIREGYPLDGFFFDEAGFQSWCIAGTARRNTTQSFTNICPPSSIGRMILRTVSLPGVTARLRNGGRLSKGWCRRMGGVSSSRGLTP